MKRLFLCGVLGCILLTSCRFDEYKPEGEMESNWILPLAYGEISVLNLIKTHELRSDSNGFVTLYLETEKELTPDLSSSDLLEDKDHVFNTTLDFGPDFFRLIKDGIIDLENPKLTLQIDNEVGISDSIYLNKAGSRNALNGKDVTLNLGGATKSEFYIAPAEASPFKPHVSTYTFTKQNSNLWDVLLNFPRHVYIDGLLRTKPTMDAQPFIADDKKVKGKVLLEVPLSMRIYNLSFSDTIPFNMQFDEQIKTSLNTDRIDIEVKEGVIKLKAANQFPIGVNARIYFIDVNNNIIDPLHTNSLGIVLPAGVPDSDGIVRTKTNFTNEFILSIEKAERLKVAKNAVISLTVNTHGSETASNFVRSYDYYKVGIGLVGGLKVKTEIK